MENEIISPKELDHHEQPNKEEQNTNDNSHITTNLVHIYHHAPGCCQAPSTSKSRQEASSCTNDLKEHAEEEPTNAASLLESRTPSSFLKKLLETTINPSNCKSETSNHQLETGEFKKPECQSNQEVQDQNNECINNESTDSKQLNKAKSRWSNLIGEPDQSNPEDEQSQEIDEEKDQEKEQDKNSLDEQALNDWDDGLYPPKPRKLWQGLSGISVMTLGVMAPLSLAFLVILSCPKRIALVLLNHPFETSIELLLLLAIPAANYILWRSICRNDLTFSIARGVLIGGAIGSSLLLSILALAAIPFSYGDFQRATGTDFSTGFFIMSCIALGSAAVAIYLVRKIRESRDFASSRARVLYYALAGAALSVMAFIGCEHRSWTVRAAEQLATSEKSVERVLGIQRLRLLKAEREVLMEASDSRAAGLAGHFIPVKESELQAVYFAVSGKPFRDYSSSDYTTMSDDYLKRHVVGVQEKGLKLERSAMNSLVHPESLTSTLDWTFVFANYSDGQKEARAEFAIPEEAVITGLSVLENGDPRNASCAAIENGDDQQYINADSTAHPAMITDLGRGRYLFTCSPVSADAQLRVNIRIVNPLKLEALDRTTLTMPRFIAANFSLTGEHSLMIESSSPLESRAANLATRRSAGGKYLITGRLAHNQIEQSSLTITAIRPASINTFAAYDELASQMRFEREKKEQEQRIKEEAEADSEYAAKEEQKLVVMLDGSKASAAQLEGVRKALSSKEEKKKTKIEEIRKRPLWTIRTIKEVTNEAPKRLFIVLDGSGSVKEHLTGIKKTLSQVPEGVSVYISVASKEDRKLEKPTVLSKALEKLDKVKFLGGQSNLEALVKAAESAGETEGSAILWIHGAQPCLSKEIFIMPAFRSHPKFYEVALDSGSTDTLEYFKNHTEIGPFASIQRTADLEADLEDFFVKWQADRKEFVSSYELKDTPPKDGLLLDDKSKQAKTELLALRNREKVDELLRLKADRLARPLAVRANIVTPISCLALMQSNGTATWTDSFDESSGASAYGKGTAQQMMTVNTAGTIRVNNLANLEAMLNMLCNLLTMSGIFAGLFSIVHGAMLYKKPIRLLDTGIYLSSRARIAFGVICILLGLWLPGVINFMVASARDANLFS